MTWPTRVKALMKVSYVSCQKFFFIRLCNVSKNVMKAFCAEVSFIINLQTILYISSFLTFSGDIEKPVILFKKDFSTRSLRNISQDIAKSCENILDLFFSLY